MKEVKIESIGLIRGQENRIIVPTVKVINHPDPWCHNDQHIAGHLVAETLEDGTMITFPVMGEKYGSSIPRNVDIRDFRTEIKPEMVDGVHYVWGRIFNSLRMWPGINQRGSFMDVDGEIKTVYSTNRRLGYFTSDGLEHEFFFRMSVLCVLYEKHNVIAIGNRAFHGPEKREG